MAYQSSMGVGSTRANWAKALLVCTILLSWWAPSPARSGTINGAMGQTSSASVGISVEVASRFTVQNSASFSSDLGEPHAMGHESNRVCIESNSGINFTVLEDPADNGSPAPESGANSSAALPSDSTCLQLRSDRAPATTDRASANATENFMRDHLVTVLVSPL